MVDSRNGSTKGFSFSAINPKGLTLPSAGTKTGNEPFFSTSKGVTDIFINSSLTSKKQAPVFAAEVGAHALPALLVLGGAIPDPGLHKRTEEPLAKDARYNANH